MPMSNRVPVWLREPLLHFLLLGGLLFAVDQLLYGGKDDPHLIKIDAAIDTQLREVFTNSRNRQPNAEELKTLRDRWVDNEVLYREGLALQVDRGDTAIRERVIFKALSVIDASVKPPIYDETVLQQWFKAHRSKYDEPARYDFQEAVLAGNTSDKQVREFTQALNAGKPGDAEAGLRVFTARPQATLVESYGKDFAAALAQAAPGKWQAIPTRDGLRVIKFDAALPARPADLQVLHNVVLQDWVDAMAAEQRTAAVRALGRKYTVRLTSDDSP